MKFLQIFHLKELLKPNANIVICSYLRMLKLHCISNFSTHIKIHMYMYVIYRGGPRGGTPGTRPPKIGKNIICLRKIVIFHTNYPKSLCASFRNWKKYDFFVVKSWFFTRNSPKMFAPPSARRNLFKCTPP